MPQNKINKNQNVINRQQKQIDDLLRQYESEKINKQEELKELEKVWRANERKKKMLAHMQNKIDELTNTLKEYNYE